MTQENNIKHDYLAPIDNESLIAHAQPLLDKIIEKYEYDGKIFHRFLFNQCYSGLEWTKCKYWIGRRIAIFMDQ